LDDQPSRRQRWKAFDRRGSDKVSSFVWRYLTPFIAGLLIATTASDLGPSWRAHQGRGTPGMVTVTHKDCGRSCSYSGDFVSDDGTIRRADVGLATGFSDVAVGVRLRAIDEGSAYNVYPPGGGEDWILTSLLFAAAIVVLLAWTYRVPVQILRRRGQPSPGTSQAVGSPGLTRVVTPGTQDGARFAVVRLRAAYAIDEVDAFLARLALGQVSSAEAVDVRFTAVRIREGYDMRDVDDYIDGVASQLRAAGR
jgi:hypothetical protein